MTRAGLTNLELAARAKVDPKTVNDFLSGKRWPQRVKRAAISTALGWPGDELDRIADTGTVSVGRDAGRKITVDGGKVVTKSLLGYPLDEAFYYQLGRLEIVLQMIPPDRLDEATTLGAQAILGAVMTPEIEELAEEFKGLMDRRFAEEGDRVGPSEGMRPGPGSEGVSEVTGIIRPAIAADEQDQSIAGEAEQLLE